MHITTCEAGEPGLQRTPENLVACLDDIAVGQRQWKEALATEVFVHRHRRSRARMGHSNADLGPRQNLLCAGPTGCGKTYIAEHAGRAFGVPFVIKDASRLTPSGIAGMSVQTIAADALFACEDDVEEAEWAMVLLDEADKLRERWAVQFELLRLVEGTTITLRVRGKRIAFDTSNMLFVAAGAFDGLADLVEQRTGGLERSGRLDTDGPRTVEQLLMAVGGSDRRTDALARCMPEDFVRYGFKEELIARFQTRVVLHELGPSALMRILSAPYSPFEHLAALCRDFGVGLDVTEAARWAVAERAASLHQGARGLQAVIEPFRRRIVMELAGLRERELCRIKLDAAQVERGAPDFEAAPPVGAALDLSQTPHTVSGEARARAMRVAELFPPGTMPERPARALGSRLARLSDVADVLPVAGDLQ